MKSNLVISGAYDLGYDNVAAFLLSLRATGSQAKVHLFLARTSERNRKKIESLGVTTEPFDYFHFRMRRPLMLLWPIWRKKLAALDFNGKCALGRKLFFFVAMRHVLYYQYLQKHRDKYHNVLLTDCRDVYFQRDPFSDDLGPGVHCFLEARTQRIGTCPANATMVRTAFGPEVLGELANEPVSCAGVTIGDAASILVYLRTMVVLLCSVRKMTAINDQAVHNYVINRCLVPDLHLHDNYTSLVFTAGCEAREDLRLNERGELIRPDGTVYPVLHQIDRHVETYERLLAKVRLP